jgi:hypothetical protein
MTMRNRLASVAFTLVALAIAAPAAQAQQVQELFSNMNTQNVQTGAASRATFTLFEPALVTEISTYHWNDGRGAQPGTITLRHHGGVVQGTYGPFPTRGIAGQYNAQNVTWVASINLTLPAGLYEVFDSSQATWSYNNSSGGRGFTRVVGYTSGPYPAVKLFFDPCSPDLKAPAIVGPCVVKKSANLWLTMKTARVSPGFVRFASGMGNPSGLIIQAPLVRQTMDTYTIRVPDALCQPGAGPNFNVILYAANGQIVGQVGTFTPDCR